MSRIEVKANITKTLNICLAFGGGKPMNKKNVHRYKLYLGAPNEKLLAKYLKYHFPLS